MAIAKLPLCGEALWLKGIKHVQPQNGSAADSHHRNKLTEGEALSGNLQNFREWHSC